MISVDNMIGMIIGGCCGDVLGSQTEGMKHEDIIKRFNGNVTLMPEGKRYTDDSEMMLILLRHVAKHKTVKRDDLHVEYSKIDFKRGYSQNTREILVSIRNRTHSLNIGTSPCDGAVMRIAPLALLDVDDKELRKNVQDAIYYTHGGNPDAHATAYVHCKLLKSLLSNENGFNRNKIFLHILELAECHKPLWIKMNIVYRCINSTLDVHSITKELTGDPNTFQIYAIDAFCCALYSFFLFYTEPMKAVSYAASMGGDTDTIAKMTGDMCGAAYGTKWIPESWRNFEDEDEFMRLTKEF